MKFLCVYLGEVRGGGALTLEDFLKNFLCIYLDEGNGGGGYTIACISAYICIGTHSQTLFQNCVMDVYETW